MINYTSERRKRRRTQILLKIQRIIILIMAKRNYINPSIIRLAMSQLEEYKTKHKNSKTPLFDFAKSEPEEIRAIYVRAAQRLKWSVIRSRGHVYENGYFIW